MRHIPAWLSYTVLRVALFMLSLVLMLWLIQIWLVAVVLAAVVSLALSLVLLRGPRDQMALSLHRVRERARTVEAGADERAEDDSLDADRYGR